MLEILLFEDSKKAVEYFKQHPEKIEAAFSDVERIRKLIINESEVIELITALDIAGLNYKNTVDAMSQLARIEVQLLQVKIYLQACEYAEKNSIKTSKLTWEI